MSVNENTGHKVGSDLDLTHVIAMYVLYFTHSIVVEEEKNTYLQSN